jgi:hypothetical protein
MADHGGGVRRVILEELWRRVEKDIYPSATMLDRIECLMTRDDLPAYVAMLMRRIRPVEHPSIDLINRVVALVCVDPPLPPPRRTRRASWPAPGSAPAG